MLSSASDADKLAAFKRENERNAKLAPVLASAFHRRPQGAFAMMPRAIELEGAVRDVMSLLGSAPGRARAGRVARHGAAPR
jgi:hypothetical protein